MNIRVLCRCIVYALVIGLVGSATVVGFEWGLPINLGDNQEKVYRILGEPNRHIPAEDGWEEVDWFLDAGLSVFYDSNKQVTKIGVPGPGSDYLLFEGTIIYGIRMRDNLSRLKEILGEPSTVSKAPLQLPFDIYRWKAQPYLIEVEIWSETHKEEGIMVHEGDIKAIWLSEARNEST